jgi:hypothetical protein
MSPYQFRKFPIDNSERMFYFSDITDGDPAMRLLALVLPRLGIQLAQRADPALAGHPVALVAGSGEGALVAVPSVEATAGGIETGMTVSQARGRVPALLAIPDNAGDCLDELESLASILRTNATTSVAIVSRDTLIVPLEGLEGRFPDEMSAATALSKFARTWTGLDVRAGVASTIDGAVQAARGARRFPVVSPDALPGGMLPPNRSDLAACAKWNTPQAAAAVESRLARALTTLESVLEASPASYRGVRVALQKESHTDNWNLRATQPLHTAAEIFELVRSRVPAAALEGVTGFTVRLERPGPDVRVNPWRRAVATMHTLSGPAVPVQHRLRLAS